MIRATYSLAIAAMVFVGPGCVSYQARPLDRSAVLEELRAARPESVVLKREDGEDAPRAGPQIDMADGLDEAEVVGVALTLNPGLKARRLEIGEAQSLLVSAGLWPNPELGLGVGKGIGGASGYTLGADLLFDLLRMGERSAAKGAAKAQVDAKHAEVVAEEFRLSRQVRRQWLAVLAAEASAGELERAVGLREKVAKLLRGRREAGDVTELELSAAEVELAQSQREGREARREAAEARRNLNYLVGLPPGYEMKLTDVGKPLQIRTAHEMDEVELDERMLAGRFELRAREADYQRAEQELRLAVLRQYPRVALGPTYERELEGDSTLGLGASIELPLFDRNQGEIAEKGAQRDRLRQEYSAAVHELRAEAAAALAQMRAAATELTTQERELLPLVQRNEELFEKAFRAGELRVLDWIAAEARSLEARREYLKAAVNYRAAVIDLEAALGICPASDLSPAVEAKTNEESR